LTFADDEEHFALAHEAELLAGQRLDRAGIFLQAPDVVPQAGVLLALLRQRRRERRVLAPRAERVDQSLVARPARRRPARRSRTQHVVEQTVRNGDAATSGSCVA
jgi:hypothetical protein